MIPRSPPRDRTVGIGSVKRPSSVLPAGGLGAAGTAVTTTEAVAPGGGGGGGGGEKENVIVGRVLLGQASSVIAGSEEEEGVEDIFCDALDNLFRRMHRQHRDPRSMAT